MEKDKPSDLEKIADVMAHRYPKFDSVDRLKNYLKGDFDNFSFVPFEATVTKTALSAILDETLKSPQRIIQSEETSYTAVVVLSGELERNPRNVVVGFLPTSVEEEEPRQFGVSTRKPVQINNVGRTMPYLWPLDTNLSGLQQNDMDSYRRIVAKRIRNAVKEKGIGFGILVGSYLGMGTDDVLKLFADDNFKKDLTGKGWQKIPSKTRDGDASAISSVKKNIDEGTQKGYEESLQTLNERGWLPSDPKILLHYVIQNVTETVTPCVHLVSASEAAVIAAAEVFKPYDLKMVQPHLQKQYQSYVTSEVKSAHIVTQKPYPKWQYQG